jgi:hypothetical protein
MIAPPPLPVSHRVSEQCSCDTLLQVPGWRQDSSEPCLSLPNVPVQIRGVSPAAVNILRKTRVVTGTRGSAVGSRNML